MVPDVICDPDFFGPREIWTPRNLVHAGPKKVNGPNEIGDHLSYRHQNVLSKLTDWSVLSHIISNYPLIFLFNQVNFFLVFLFPLKHSYW